MKEHSTAMQYILTFPTCDNVIVQVYTAYGRPACFYSTAQVSYMEASVNKSVNSLLYTL